MDLAVTAQRVPLTGEIVLAGSFRMGPGGKGANAATALARLGACSMLVGCVGDDQLGFMEMEALKREGVNLDGVRTALGESTGVGIIIVDGNKENTVLVVMGANSSLTVEFALGSLEGAWEILDALVVNFEVPEPVVAAVVTEGRRKNVPVIVDAGPSRRYEAATWRGATVLSPNRLEAETLLGREIRTEKELRGAARELLAAGPESVVIKLGGDGCLVCTEEGLTHVPAFKVGVVDTTGAGDAFTAALAFGIAQGRTLAEAVELGTAAGALATTRFGTMPSMPTYSEVGEFLRVEREKP